MLASLAETVSSWAFPGGKRRKRRSDASVTSHPSGEQGGVTDVAPPRTGSQKSSLAPAPPEAVSADSRTADHSDADHEAAAPGPITDDPAESMRNEMHRGIETGIEQIMSLFPAIGENSDAQDVLESARNSASSNIPQPPAAAQAVLSLCQRWDYSLLELTELIERDPSLSAALLRHANSAWYARPGSLAVTGLRAAVHRVGTNGVHAAVMSRIVEGALSRPGPKFNAPARMVWHHMVRVAPIARELAAPFGADTHVAYSLGLLHDVGKLVLFHHISNLRRTRRREVIISEEFLWLALASLHQPLGGLALLEWGLDEKAAHVVANHHRFPKPEPENILTEVVFLAERIDIAEQRGVQLDIEPLWDTAGLTGPRAAVRDFVKARMEGEFSFLGSSSEGSQPTNQPIGKQPARAATAGSDRSLGQASGS